MTLKLTPAALASMYEFLRTVPPYTSWKLPPAETVNFKVLSSGVWMGEFRGGDRRIKPTIAISRLRVGHALTLVSVMAHEMIHFHLDLIGKGNVNHGPEFQKCARRACKSLGLDLKEFS